MLSKCHQHDMGVAGFEAFGGIHGVSLGSERRLDDLQAETAMLPRP